MLVGDYRRYLDMMNQWLILSQEGKRLDRFLKERGWCKVAVYGMSIYGRHIIRELENTDCVVMYAIDRKRMDDYRGIKVLKPADSLPNVDVVINSVIHEHDRIAEDMHNIVQCPIVSLVDVVFESY